MRRIKSHKAYLESVVVVPSRASHLSISFPYFEAVEARPASNVLSNARGAQVHHPFLANDSHFLPARKGHEGPKRDGGGRSARSSQKEDALGFS